MAYCEQVRGTSVDGKPLSRRAICCDNERAVYPCPPGRNNHGHEATATTLANREVGAQIDVEVTAPTTLEFQVAVARQPGLDIRESLTITFNGNPVQPREIIGPHDTRIHSIEVGEGGVSLSYQATVSGEAKPAPIRDIDLITYLRPSRYAESDKFFGFAATEFGPFADSATLLEKVSSWVGARLDYVPGSSDPIDGAADTLLASAGVCRDYAHLVIAMLRALKLPARLAAVYAPGCDPMDFHAVAEAYRGWGVARRRRDLSGSAAVDGADRHRPRRRRHRVPGQPWRRNHIVRHDRNRLRRRRAALRFDRPSGQPG